MITINSLKEMKPYYNSKTNTYEFNDAIYFIFDLAITANIKAGDIKAYNINASDIKAGDIDAYNIKASDINACDIKAGDINACNIDAWDINACNIDAWDIKAWSINANDITFYAVCFAHETFVCNSIVGERENSKYFCLDSKVIVKGK